MCFSRANASSLAPDGLEDLRYGPGDPTTQEDPMTLREQLDQLREALKILEGLR